MFEDLSRKPENLIENIVLMQEENLADKACLSVRFDPEQIGKYVYDGANFAYFPVDFHNGTIEVELLGTLEENAPKEARGFIGLAFRISEDLSKFESIYVRPTNGRADDQVRRNHSTQYFSFPDYKFDRLRKEEPEKYESYCDIDLGEWIHLRITVEDEKARLYVNHSKEPVLIVNDLKHGKSTRGGIGLWIDIGTLGYFRNLKVEP